MKPLCFAVAALVGFGVWPATQMDASSRERARVMLRHAYELVKKHYYDEKFHGLDLDARYRNFDEQMKGAPSLNAGMALVADFLDGLQDSHTYFVPPARPYDFGLSLPGIRPARLRHAGQAWQRCRRKAQDWRRGRRPEQRSARSRHDFTHAIHAACTVASAVVDLDRGRPGWHAA
jgi:hypothetical protein